MGTRAREAGDPTGSDIGALPDEGGELLSAGMKRLSFVLATALVGSSRNVVPVRSRYVLLALGVLCGPVTVLGQVPGDSVRLRLPMVPEWRYGRLLTIDDQELVVGDLQGVQVFNRRLVERLERYARRSPHWVVGKWAAGGLAAGVLVAAFASNDATTEDVVLSIAAGAIVGCGAGLLDFKVRPARWVVVPAP